MEKYFECVNNILPNEKKNLVIFEASCYPFFLTIYVRGELTIGLLYVCIYYLCIYIHDQCVYINSEVKII